jgi:protease-4
MAGPLALAVVCTACTIVTLAALGAAAGSSEVRVDQLPGGPAVAIVRVDGVIVSGRAQPNLFDSTAGVTYSETLLETLQRAEDRSDVRAIVLRVDSPGGSVVASEEIYRGIKDDVKKPIVTSMGEVAASGGYYIAMATDHVVAGPATLTGSIGVIAQVANVEGLMDKLGIDIEVIKSGRFKDELSPFRSIQPAERQHWEDIIMEAYHGFVDVVAEGRDMEREEVTELADGRVFTGRQAQANGLIDEVGDLSDAVDKAAELGSIEGEPRIIELRPDISPLDLLLRSRVAAPGLEQILGACLAGRQADLRGGLLYLYR